MGSRTKGFTGKRHSSETRKKMSRQTKKQWQDKNYRTNVCAALGGRVGGFLGKKHSQETRKKMSQAQKGRIISARHRARLSQTCKEKFRNDAKFRQRLLRQCAQIPSKFTKIEICVWEVLKKLRVRIVPQKLFRIKGLYLIADFFLPDYSIVIECDGEYWHSKVEAKRRDHLKNQMYRKLELRVVRLRERDIKDNAAQALLSGLSNLLILQPQP